MLESIPFLIAALFSGLAILSGFGFVVFRQPVYAALCFTATVLAAAVLYIMLEATYLAAATMVIYAGATIIIFLFVLMFAQRSNLQLYELKYSNLGPALAASIALVLLLGYALSTREDTQSGIAHLPMPPQPITTTTRATPTGENAAVVGNAASTRDAGSATQNTGSATQNTGSATQNTGSATPAPLPGNDMSVAALGRVTYTRYLWTIELAGTLLLVAACGAIVIAQRETTQTDGASA